LIRKINPQTDLIDFKEWALTIPQSPEFNWTQENLLEGLNEDICWGLWYNSKLQSVVCFLKNSQPTEIMWLATRPDSARQGHMKNLLIDVTTNAASKSQLKGGQILLEVHEMNLKAIRLYSSLGFIEFGRRKNYYKDGQTALVMALKLE
jgi:[ribosomal protein S18]-alanine N-acetyltransferase